MPRRGQGKNTLDERGTVRVVVQLTNGRLSHYKGNVTRSFSFHERTVTEVAAEVEAKLFGSATGQEAVGPE